MLFIYSNEVIEGKDGVYCNPIFFTNVNTQASEVLTDDKEIAKKYEEADIPVSPLTVKKRTRKSKES